MVGGCWIRKQQQQRSQDAGRRGASLGPRSGSVERPEMGLVPRRPQRRAPLFDDAVVLRRIEIDSVQQLVHSRLLRIMQKARPLRLRCVFPSVERLRPLARRALKLGRKLVQAPLGQGSARVAVLVE